MNRYEVSLEVDPNLKERITEKLCRFNISQIGEYDYCPLNLTVRGEDQKIIGSLIGHTGLDWLYIDILWVDEERRRSGIGSNLINEAEKEAIKRRCRGSYLYTYSFQNPGFYEKMGYTKFGELPDFPLHHIKYFMKKQFTLLTKTSAAPGDASVRLLDKCKNQITTYYGGVHAARKTEECISFLLRFCSE